MVRWAASALMVLALGLVTWGLLSPGSRPATGWGGSPGTASSAAAEDATCLPAGVIGNYSPQLVRDAVADAQLRGSARRGAMVFGSAHFACLSCHRVGDQGGDAGPNLSSVGQRLSPQKIVESLYWPRRDVRPEYRAWVAQTARFWAVPSASVPDSPSWLPFARKSGTECVTMPKWVRS